MTRCLCSLIVLCCLYPSAYAQEVRQSENWHFGQGISIRFIAGSPTLSPPSSIHAIEGAASLSDTNGVLQFYTNGGGRLPASGEEPGTIWNRNHEVLYDMRGFEGGSFDARQSAVAVPDPAGRPGIYYLFTVEENNFDQGGSVPGQPDGRGLSYFVIDMNLNGGLGGVVEADRRVTSGAKEALAVVRRADGDGYWIFSHNGDRENPLLVRASLTASGGVSEATTLPFSQVVQRIKFSPDGRYVWMAGGLYRFGAASGEVGQRLNNFELGQPLYAGFSADSRFLYTNQVATEVRSINRYEIADLEGGSWQLLLPLPGGGRQARLSNFQLGPDGRLYVLSYEQSAAAGQNLHLLAVTGPGSETCFGITLVDLDLSPFVNGPTLPNLPQFDDGIFRQLPSNDTLVLSPRELVSCAGPDTLQARRSGDRYLWSDGSRDSTVVARQSGTYCVTITDGCEAIVDCTKYRSVEVQDNITLTELSNFEQPDACNPVRRFVVNLPVLADTSITSAGLLVNYRLGGEAPVLLSLDRDEAFEIPLVPDSVWLTIAGQLSCGADVQLDTLLAARRDQPDYRIVVAQRSEPVCLGREFTFAVEPLGDAPALIGVDWFDGSQTEVVTTLVVEGTTVEATVLNACGEEFNLTFRGDSIEPCPCEVVAPEIISANRDGLNDAFKVFSDCELEDFSVAVFNRWGQKIFTSSDPDEGFVGEVNGRPVDLGTYLFVAQYRLRGQAEIARLDGSFVVVR